MADGSCVKNCELGLVYCSSCSVISTSEKVSFVCTACNSGFLYNNSTKICE